MVDRLSAFPTKVTRVAREVGTAGILGGQANVRGVPGTWRPHRQVTRWEQPDVAGAEHRPGDDGGRERRPSNRIDVDARGEILELKTTINTMVARLSAFAAEWTRVAREVGTEGKLRPATVADVSGTWQRSPSL